MKTMQIISTRTVGLNKEAAQELIMELIYKEPDMLTAHILRKVTVDESSCQKQCCMCMRYYSLGHHCCLAGH